MIDWNSVKKELLDKEGIAKIRDAHQKEVLLACADECLGTAKKLARPRSVSNIKPISCFSGLSTGKKISSYIKGSDKACAFAVTIGAALESEATRLMESGDHLKGYLLDRIGSFAADDLAENLENELRKKCASKKMSVSSRFSPGYCQWPIEDQKKLSKLADFSKAGIRLTKSFVMLPKKSVSGIIGIGPKGLFTKKMSQCSICDRKDCYLRRSPKRRGS